MAALVLQIRVSKGYTLSYFDCQRPKTVHKYARNEICQPPEVSKGQPKQYQIVQEEQVREMEGYSCSMTVSTFVFRCGAWSHLKVALVPEIDHPEPISLTWCNEMTKRRKFKSSASEASHQLELDTVNIISQVERGSLQEVSDRIQCTGEDFHSGNRVHTNVVLMKEYKIILRREKYTTDGKVVEVKSEQISLPCGLKQGGCQTGVSTYLWERPETDCALHLVRPMRAVNVLNTYLLDEDSRILINITGKTRLLGCDRFEVWKTSFPHLYLVEAANVDLPVLSSGALSLEMESRLVHDYMEYREEERERQTQHAMNNIVCENHKHLTRDQPVHIAGDLFSITRGDLVVTFRCANRTAPIANLDRCYDLVPIEHDGIKFVDPATRVLTEHSAQADCNPYFPLTVRADKGIWVQLTPHIRTITPPAEGQPQAVTGHQEHLDLSRHTLYTDKEVNAWEQYLMFPQYHQAIMKTLSWGSCVGDSTCQGGGTAGITPLSLNNLALEIQEKLDLWNKLRAWIREYGDLLALAVVGYVSFKLLIHATILTLTLLKEGPKAAMALMINLYFNIAVQRQKIIRRNQRLRRELNQAVPEPKPEEEEIPLQVHLH
jgi:hypothetical protein